LKNTAKKIPDGVTINDTNRAWQRPKFWIAKLAAELTQKLPGA